MKILYLSNEDVPGDHAGAVHTWEVARGLARRGHDVTLVSAAAPGLSRRERKDGVLIIRAPSRLAGIKCNLRAAPLLLELWQRRWNVVMERYLTLNGLGYICAAARGTAYYVEVNGPHLEEITYRRRLAGTLLLRLLTWWVDRQFARADGACAPNVNIIRPAARPRAHEIFWGVNEEQFSARLATTPRAKRRRDKFGEARFVVLFVGSFRPWQGARELPAIIARTLEALPETVFWVVGDGPERDSMEDELRRRGVAGAVHFFGWQPHDTLPYIAAAADAAVAPFNDAYYPPLRDFGFYWAPTKVLECLASGLPVVTSRYPVLDKLVEEGRSGYLVLAGDADAFARALGRLGNDAAARAAMGRYAEESVKANFGWRRHCEILEGFLEEAVARRKNRCRRR